MMNPMFPGMGLRTPPAITDSWPGLQQSPMGQPQGGQGAFRPVQSYLPPQTGQGNPYGVPFNPLGAPGNPFSQPPRSQTAVQRLAEVFGGRGGRDGGGQGRGPGQAGFSGRGGYQGGGYGGADRGGFGRSFDRSMAGRGF